MLTFWFLRFLSSVWANHGDDISIQYSGTPALKGDFVRYPSADPFISFFMQNMLMLHLLKINGMKLFEIFLKWHLQMLVDLDFTVLISFFLQTQNEGWISPSLSPSRNFLFSL